MKDGWPETMEELKASCVTMREALVQQFGEIREVGDGYLKVSCCGSEANMLYGHGIGPDRAHCKVCRREIFDALSPFVSPFLHVQPESVCVPNEETAKSFGERTWFVTPFVAEGVTK
jgi:hypothetical protein